MRVRLFGCPCRRARASLDEWLDARSLTPLRPDTAEHLKACPECRAYVTQWHAVELELRRARDAFPSDLQIAMVAPDPHRFTERPSMHVRRTEVAMASALAALLLLALAAGMFVSRYLLPDKVLALRGGNRTLITAPQTPEAVAPDLPVAATPR